MQKSICHFSKKVIVALSVLSLSSCASLNNMQAKDALSPECLGSAIAGGFMGMLLNTKNSANGAIAGAAAGMITCLAVKSNTRQLKTAAAYEKEVMAKNRGRLPVEASASSHTIAVKPGNKLARSTGVATIVTMVGVANGSQVSVNDLREEIIILMPDGSEKVVNKETFKEKGGLFEKTTELKLNNGLDEGFYGVKTNVYINNVLASSKTTSLQLVFNPSDFGSTYASRY
jgi:hypothetical protein